MINHNHRPVKGIMTPALKARFEEFAKQELVKIESVLSDIASAISENARDIPTEWENGCQECEDSVLDGYDMAYAFLCKEFMLNLENQL